MLSFDLKEVTIDIDVDATVGDLKMRLAAETGCAESSFHIHRNGRYVSNATPCLKLRECKISMNEKPPKQTAEANLRSKCKRGVIKHSPTLRQIAASSKTIESTTAETSKDVK